MTTPPTLYCVIYRTGGTERWTWHRSLAMDKEMAEAMCESVQRMGYRAFVERYDRSLSIGLPETYEATDPVGLDPHREV